MVFFILFYVFLDIQEIPAFTASLVNQLSSNLKRIHRLGVRKIAVALSLPLGCLPTESAANSYEKCSASANLVAKSHSQMLLQTLQNMNRKMGRQVFVTLDLYNIFLSFIISVQKQHAGNVLYMFPNTTMVNIMSNVADENENVRTLLRYRK